jgi:hypothetical protein
MREENISVYHCIIEALGHTCISLDLNEVTIKELILIGLDILYH